MDRNTQPFQADCDPRDFDRKIQSKMAMQADLKKWAIVYSEECKRDCTQFVSTLQQCANQFQFNMTKPKLIEISRRSRTYQDWKDEIDRNINSSVDFVVFILPG